MRIETAKVLPLVSLAAALLAGSARAAEIVVLESNTTRYAVGQKLEANAPLTLSDGQTIVLATDDGRVLVVQGPHEGPAAGKPPTQNRLRRLLTQLFGLGRPQVEGLGGVRGGLENNPQDRRPNAWLIHAERTSDQCVIRGEPVRFWREDPHGVAHSTIIDLASGASAQLDWSDQGRADWPLAAGPQDHRIYLVRPAGALRSAAIRLHVLASGVAGKGLTTVAWLAATGCVAQARILLREVPETQQE